MQRRIGQRGRCPSRYGGKTPYEENKTPHEEIIPIAASVERKALTSGLCSINLVEGFDDDRRRRSLIGFKILRSGLA